MSRIQTHTCSVSGCQELTHTVGGCCEKHNAPFHAKWKEEHTRRSGDTRKCWLIGDACRVTLRDVAYDARIIDIVSISHASHRYDTYRLELTRTVTGLDGKAYTQTWVHPEPVQSYKLKKRLLED